MIKKKILPDGTTLTTRGQAREQADDARREGSWSITPKGTLLVLMMNHGRDIEAIWSGLTDFVAKRAASNGMTEGMPCLALEGGGHCITAERKAQGLSPDVANTNASGVSPEGPRSPND